MEQEEREQQVHSGQLQQADEGSAEQPAKAKGMKPTWLSLFYAGAGEQCRYFQGKSFGTHDSTTWAHESTGR